MDLDREGIWTQRVAFVRRMGRLWNGVLLRLGAAMVACSKADANYNTQQ